MERLLSTPGIDVNIKASQVCICTYVRTFYHADWPFQDGYTPLHFAAREGHTACVECLLSSPGIDVNIKGRVSLWHMEQIRGSVYFV